MDAYKLISGGEVAAKPVEGGAGNIEAGGKSIEEDVVVWRIKCSVEVQGNQERGRALVD